MNHVYAIDSYAYLNNLCPSLLVKVIYPASNGSVTEWETRAGTMPEAIDDTVPDQRVNRRPPTTCRGYRR